ncbi:Legume lectin domain containing protein [Parasponia andersonii]|uniref:Legume lectin domain containing protein n=1 Tax=Parasponia andersonii TaxID=3476 RepID=A0A2P5D718_PARAD|nr:Legume lectin domain containing protein [Parasponia andersonii]
MAAHTKPISFSTEFTFSISLGNGEGLVLVLVPSYFASKFSGGGSFGLSSKKRFLGIEFDIVMDGNMGDLNMIHVDVGSFVSVAIVNISSIDLVHSSGEKLKSWIDYDLSSDGLEVLNVQCFKLLSLFCL